MTEPTLNLTDVVNLNNLGERDIPKIAEDVLSVSKYSFDLGKYAEQLANDLAVAENNIGLLEKRLQTQFSHLENRNKKLSESCQNLYVAKEDFSEQKSVLREVRSTLMSTTRSLNEFRKQMAAESQVLKHKNKELEEQITQLRSYSILFRIGNAWKSFVSLFK